MKFYQLPNSNLFTHHLLSFSREATSETYGPRVLFLIYLLAIYFSFAFLFRSIKPKNKILCRTLFYLWSIISIYFNFWHRYPKGIDNPFNTSGCEVLLFVSSCYLRCVAWFSYWFDNLGFFSKGNTYRRCAASSLPLWGNTNIVLADMSFSGAIVREQSRITTTIFAFIYLSLILSYLLI